MAWIKTVDPEEAEGLLGRLFRAALKRTGKIYNVIRVQSPRPRVLKASTNLYLEIMHGDDCGLTRAQREMIATAVSSFNDCHY